MFYRKFSLVAGVILVSLSTQTIAVRAETTSQTPQLRLAQAQQRQPAANPPIQLRPDQEKKRVAIETELRNEIGAIFTREQKQKINAQLRAGKAPQEAFESIRSTLTDDQMNRIDAAVRKAQNNFLAILDDKQKAQLQQSQQQNSGASSR